MTRRRTSKQHEPNPVDEHSGRGQPAKPQLTPADVIRVILQHEIEGKPLTAIHVRTNNRPLAAAGIRHFGCWSKALEAAGIDPEAVSKRRDWSLHRVIEAIHALDRQGVPLNCVSAKNADSGLVQAAAKCFGSWNEALRVAGYDPKQLRVKRRPWTRQDIIGLIRHRAAAGLSIAAHNVRPQSAEVAARRIFGNWRSAIRAAGVKDPTAQYPIWTKVNILEGIMLRHQAGQPLNSAAVQRQDSRLYDAARRHFDTWPKALRQAGIDPVTVQRRRRIYTKQNIIAHLHRYARDGGTGYRPSDHPESVVKAARRLFGDWRSAVVAAGCAEPDNTSEAQCPLR